MPETPHLRMVREIDAIETEMYRLYERLERLRLDLQREWRVLPSGVRWTEGAHARTYYSKETDGE